MERERRKRVSFVALLQKKRTLLGRLTWRFILYITPTLIRTISLYGERQRAGSSHDHIFQSCTVAWWAKTRTHTLSRRMYGEIVR